MICTVKQQSTSPPFYCQCFWTPGFDRKNSVVRIHTNILLNVMNAGQLQVMFYTIKLWGIKLCSLSVMCFFLQTVLNITEVAILSSS